MSFKLGVRQRLVGCSQKSVLLRLEPWRNVDAAIRRKDRAAMASERGTRASRRGAVCGVGTERHSHELGAAPKACSIEIEECARCGGRLQVMASIEEPELSERILAHRRERGEQEVPTASLETLPRD